MPSNHQMFEVLTRRPDGHETVVRVRATSAAAVQKAVREALDGDRRGGEVADAASVADGGLGDSGSVST